MSTKASIEKIKSKYILNGIFDYISKENYKLKLFINSKTLQEKYNIKIEYKYCFLKEHLKAKEYIKLDLINGKLDTNYFYDNLNNLLNYIHLSVSESKQISQIIYEDYIKIQRKEQKKSRYIDYLSSLSTIDIYSPFIEFAISHDYHFINIPLKDIEKYKLKDDYISFFKKENSTKNLKILVSLEKSSQMEILKDLNIDFSLINQLVFAFTNSCSFELISKKDIFFNELYSLIKMPNKNLEVLDLYFDSNYLNADDVFSNWLNGLTQLKVLKFRRLSFSNNFIINLPKLEILKLILCNNVSINNEIVNKNLKLLELFETDLNSPNNFENLEDLEIIQADSSYESINFKSLKNLKYFKANNFYLINNIEFLPSIEKLIYSPYYFYNGYYIEERDILNKIISNKTLKAITVEFHNITNDQLESIKKINNEIEDITLYRIKNSNYDIKDFLRKFKSIKKLRFENKENKKTTGRLFSNSNEITIEELELPNPSFPISFSFSYLRTLSINFTQYYEKYEIFPLFDSYCNVKFFNLENLKIIISVCPCHIKIIQNFANNIIHFRNIKNLYFDFLIEDMNDKIYSLLIENLLSLNLVKLHISFNINGWTSFYKFNYKFYTRAELTKVFSKKIKDNSEYKIQRVKNLEKIKTEKDCFIF